MLVKLYKPGVMIEVYGIACDWKNVDELHLDGYLSSGWYRSPLDFDTVIEGETVEVEEKPKKRGRPAKVKADADEE